MAPVVSRWGFAGLFVTCLATLMYEILLTRIFSATLLYHFAFVALSIGLFGMTLGALSVYLFPERFPREHVHEQLAHYSFLFAASTVVSFLLHLAVPLFAIFPPVTVVMVAIKFLIVSVPFWFSGICTCLALTRFPGQVSRLYAADLVGSSVGCLTVLLVLKIMDAPTAVVLVAVLGAVGACCFAAERHDRSRESRSLWLAGGCLALVVVNMGMVRVGASLLRPPAIDFPLHGKLIYDRWNSFSHLTVEGNPDSASKPFGWGLSSTYPDGYRIPQLKLAIDGAAATVLTKFDGDLSAVDYLRFDVTNLVHAIRPDSRVLVVGVGGGRDILSALYFGQRSVTGVELNEDILKTLNRRFGDFTGHLDRNPRVTFINDEARAYAARTHETFDVIQASLTDTWAATAAGAFVLSENSLYTVEAFGTFLDRLTPHGILTVSRWYQEDLPAEVYRLTALAMQALRDHGITRPRDHIFLATQILPRVPGWLTPAMLPPGVGTSTILVSKAPFSGADVDRLEQLCREMKFRVTLSPRSTADPLLARMADAADLNAFAQAFPLDISPPRDDRPFFFYLFRARDLASWFKTEGMNDRNRLAIFTLAALLVVICTLTVVCILVPLWLRGQPGVLRGALPLVAFFACIGFGFMTLETAQMQRLIIFLGHPSYGLSVVLLSLLLASGLGSYTTQGVDTRGGRIRLVGLLGVLFTTGLATPVVTRVFAPTPLAVHILVSIVLLFPMGFFMGMAFPLGMKVAQARVTELTPWLWGINGAASVCASVIAIIVAMNAGVSVTFWAGAAFYVLALLSYRRSAPLPAR